MTAYSLTEDIITGAQALVNLTTGDRFEFPPEDGPLLASMFDGTWPECPMCDSRETCEDCGECSDCTCTCEEPEDDEDCDHGGSPGVTICQHCAPGEEVTQ